jgi:hypothetical protein
MLWAIVGVRGTDVNIIHLASAIKNCVAIPNPLTSQLPLEHADLRLNSLADLPLKTLLARFSDAPPSPSI